MSIAAKFKTSKKSTKLIALALVMAVAASGLAVAANHNSKSASKGAANSKSSGGTKTITTKDGKKITVPTPRPQTSEQKTKQAEARLQKRIDSAIEQKRITEAQAKLIKAKAAEVAKNNVNVKDGKVRTELQKELYDWAKDNKIPLSFVFEMSRSRG